MNNHQNKNHNFISRMFNLSTIKAKFLVPISLMLVILFALLEVGFIQYYNSQAKTKLNNDTKMITALETNLLDVPVWNYNEEHIKEVAKYSFQNKEVVYIKVYDNEEGTDLLAGYCRDKEWGIKTWNDDSIIDDPYLITQKATINRIVDGKNTIIGLVEMGFTSKFYQKEKITTVLFIMLFGFFVLALVLGLLIVITKVITNPILKLATISEQIAKGDLSQKVDIKSKDEIGILAQAFNNMTEELNKTIVSLDQEIIMHMQEKEEKEKLAVQLLQAHKMEAIGTLAGGIAHNFNNLLMGIMGNASLLLMDIDSEHPYYKNLRDIEKQVKNGSKLTAQLVGFARKGQYEVKPISLNQMVKETSNTFGLTRKEIVIHQELDDKLCGIKADQGQIEQTLLNLYVNAVDAMTEGGNLFLKTQNVTHKDMTGRPYDPKPGDYTLLTIRDDGAGMDKETMERIFEPFFTTKGLTEGTGLGLASAYGIIKGHSGYIDVDSAKGHGTTFSIYLPQLEEVVKNKKELPGEIAKGKESVLLIDDEEMVLDIGEQILEKLGYEVLLAMSGIEALELYEKNQDKIDIILLDMVMPGMGGGKTYDKMREINSHIKFLLTSGYSIDGEAKKILERGCDGFIQKPFSIEELSNKIREILDKG